MNVSYASDTFDAQECEKEMKIFGLSELGDLT